jgi:hypothetical protein
MSQTSATARVAARAPVRRESPAQRLRVVPGAAGEPRGGLFAALCVTLLAGGLLAVLMFNTSLAQGSFVLHDLQARSGELADTQEALTQAIDAQRAPAQLARQARALGMVPADSAAFLRLSDGKILGVAKTAERDPGFAVVTAPVPVRQAQPTTPAPKKTVVKEGNLTTTTVVSIRANGEVVTTVTTVDAKTRTTTTRTTVTQPPSPTRTASSTASPSTTTSPQPTTPPVG